MAKAKVLRSAKSHQVKVQEGSNVAQRRTGSKSGPREDLPPQKPASRVPEVPSKPHHVTRLAPQAGAIKTRKMPSLPSSEPAFNNPPRKPAPPPANTLWTADKAVLHRLNDLRQRNALLADQLDRLNAATKDSGR